MTEPSTTIGDVTDSNVIIGDGSHIHVYYDKDAKSSDPPPRYVFISYARLDHAEQGRDPACFVQKLYATLKAEGFTPWLDWQDLPSRGIAFPKELQIAIENADQMIAVCGPHYPPSDWSRVEREHARKYCMPVTPVLVDGDFSDSLPADLSMKNCLDMRAGFDAAWPDLLERLQDKPAPMGQHEGDPIRIPPTGALPRTDLIEQIRASIRPDDSLPVVISGSTKQAGTTVQAAGGLGKTILASMIAFNCEVRRGFPDGIIWVTVGREANADGLRIKLGAAFGKTVEEMKSPAALTKLLRNKDCLIIFDDVWDYAPVQANMVPGADIRYLLTTRKAEIVAEFPEDNRIKLGYLTPDTGADLIAGALGLEGADYPHRETHRNIAKKLGGHTGAIAIAAAKLDAERYGHDYAPKLLERLNKGKNIFAKLMQVGSEREKNLELMLSLSYTDLAEADGTDSDLQRRFRALGIFTEGAVFSVGAAASVWGDDDEDDALDALIDLSGLALVERSEDGDYTLHALTRLYALRLLQQAGEEDAAFARYADYATAAAAGFDELPQEQWAQLDPHLPHIEFVGNQLAERFEPGNQWQEQALVFAVNVKSFVFRRPQMQQQGAARRLRGLNWLQMGLDAARAAKHQRGEALFLAEVGSVWRVHGERHKALEFYNQALPIQREVGDRAGEATTLTNIGVVWNTFGEPHKALDFYNQALPILREVGDRSVEAATLTNIGEVWRSLGDPHKTLEFLEQALPIVREVGDRSVEAATLNNIGGVWDNLGEPHKALDFYNQALPIRRAVGDRYGEAITCYNIAFVQRALGDLEQAVAYLERCVELGEAVSSRHLDTFRNKLAQVRAERDAARGT